MTELTAYPKTALRKSWQFVRAWRTILGDPLVMKILGCGLRQLQRCSANPDYTESAQKNILDRLASILRHLVLVGYEWVAVDTLSFLARQIGYRVVPEGDPVPDKEDWRDEIVDDYPAITEFHKACQCYREGNAPAEDVQHTCEEAVRELLETKVSVLGGGGK